MTGGGQPIPPGLSCPPPGFLSSDWLWILNCCLKLLQLLMDMFRKIQILPAGIRKPISWNSSIYWWGLTYPSWFTLPPTHDGWGATYPSWFILPPNPEFWAVNGNGFWIAVNYFSTINGYVSQNTDTACWYTKNHFLKFTQIQVGGNISQLVYLTPPPKILEQGLVYLAPHLDFWAVIGYILPPTCKWKISWNGIFYTSRQYLYFVKQIRL